MYCDLLDENLLNVECDVMQLIQQLFDENHQYKRKFYITEI